jgi:hypothetical protein
MDKKALSLTNGFIIRLFASVIDVISLPFLILNPSNPLAQISFGFGNFLLVIGGLVE